MWCHSPVDFVGAGVASAAGAWVAAEPDVPPVAAEGVAVAPGSTIATPPPRAGTTSGVLKLSRRTSAKAVMARAAIPRFGIGDVPFSSRASRSPGR